MPLGPLALVARRPGQELVDARLILTKIKETLESLRRARGIAGCQGHLGVGDIEGVTARMFCEGGIQSFQCCAFPTLLGVDLVWFGVMVGMNLQMSFLTPPFGFALFYLRGVAPPEIATTDIY